jgi:hypothetical protein
VSSEESRTERRAGRRRRRQANSGSLFIILAVIVVAGLGWGAWNFFGSGSVAKKGKTTVVKVSPDNESTKTPKKTMITQRSFVILGVSEADGEENLTGAVEIVFDPAQNSVGGLYLDPATFVLIPGRGLQSISGGYKEGAKKLSQGIEDLVGVEAEGYLVVSDADFTTLKETKDLSPIFGEYNDGSVPRSESKKLAAQMKIMPKDRFHLYDLPVRELPLGESVYYEPVQDELGRLVKAIWGHGPKQNEDEVRVIILNGCGAPGIGQQAADKLIKDGYKIVDVKNADNFDYSTTRIIVYNPRAKKAGSRMADSLGVGKVAEDSMVQDVTDVVIILGKDFI